jgi:hypothetical protein
LSRAVPSSRGLGGHFSLLFLAHFRHFFFPDAIPVE